MIIRTLLGCAMTLALCLPSRGTIQLGDARANLKDRVLDLLFPLKPSASPFLSKITLRFGDSDTQIAVITYPVYPVHPGGRAEIVRYSLAGMCDGELSQLISKMVAEHPNVTERDIAAKLRVNVSRSPIGYEALDRLLNELKSIRISPMLESRIAVDEYSDYEFWYDGGQESVHYAVTGPFKDAPQDKLVQWMIRFRSSVPDMLKAGSTPKP